MTAGDTFYLRQAAADGHLWVIISDPEQDPDRVLFVSMTSHDVTKEDVCLIQAGEHSRISHQTCICYEFARQTTQANLDQLRSAGMIQAQPPVSTDLLARIRRGAALSRRIAFEHIELLDQQNLLD